MSDFTLSPEIIAARAIAAEQANMLASVDDQTMTVTGQVGGLVALADYYKPTGVLYETVPRFSPRGNDGAPVSGKLLLTAIGLPAALQFSSITFVGAIGGDPVSPTHQWFGLFDSDYHMLANTDDALSAAWTTIPAGNPPILTLTITTDATGTVTSYTTPYAGLYFLGGLWVASTPPQMQQGTLQVAADLLPLLSFDSTGSLTGPPSYPFTAAGPIIAPPTGGQLVYAYVSA